MITDINSVFNRYSQTNERKTPYPLIYSGNMNFKGTIKFKLLPQNSENNKTLKEIIDALKEQNLIISEKITKRYRNIEYNDKNLFAFDRLITFLGNCKIKVNVLNNNFSLHMDTNLSPKSVPEIIKRKKEMKEMKNYYKLANVPKNNFNLISKADLWNKFADNLALPENCYLLDQNGNPDNRIKVLKYIYEQWNLDRDIVDGINQETIAKATKTNYPVVSKTLKYLKDHQLIECYKNKSNSYNYKIDSRFFEIATGNKKYNTARFEISKNKLTSDQLKIIKSKIEKYKNEHIITKIIEDNDQLLIEFDHNKAFKNEEIFELKVIIELASKFNTPATLSIPSRHIKTNFTFPEGVMIKSNHDNELLESAKNLKYETSPVSIVNTAEFVNKTRLNPMEYLVLKCLLINNTSNNKVFIKQKDLVKELGLSETAIRNVLKGLETKNIIEVRKKNYSYNTFTEEFINMIGSENFSTKVNIFENASNISQSVEISV